MARFNLDSMSANELVALEAKLKVAIADAREQQRAEVKAKMTALAEQHGFAMQELFGSGGRSGSKKTAGVAKYANPDDRAQVWTGRGRRPRWVVSQLKKGKKLEDFGI
jgi:DNA-binding protein H-NS